MIEYAVHNSMHELWGFYVNTFLRIPMGHALYSNVQIMKFLWNLLFGRLRLQMLVPCGNKIWLFFSVCNGKGALEWLKGSLLGSSLISWFSLYSSDQLLDIEIDSELDGWEELGTITWKVSFQNRKVTTILSCGLNFHMAEVVLCRNSPY